MENNNNLNKYLPIIVSVSDVVANIVGIFAAYKLSKKVGFAIIFASVILLLIIVAIFAYNFFKSKKAINIYTIESAKQQQKITSDFHHIIHKIRDTSFHIRYKENSSYEQMEYLFERIEVDICSDIEIMFEKIYNRKTSVCLKLIKSNDIVNADLNTLKLYTFARGRNSSNNTTQSGRSKNDQTPVLVSENSDFKIIINGITNFFVCKDMRNIRDDFFKSYNIPYENSTKNFSDYYNSTIVVPIRIENKHFNSLQSNCNNFHILGFLCVDTFEPFSSQKDIEIFNIGIEYVKALADALYYQILGYFIEGFKLRDKLKKENDAQNV